MRILYDARKISAEATGVGYVVKKLLYELLVYKELEIVAFTKKGVKTIFNTQISNLVVHETNDDSEYFGLKRVLFEQTQIPKLIYKYRPDILHLTNGFGVPLFMDKKTKLLLTIHDLIPFTSYKELMSPINTLIFKTLFSRGIRKADAIITVSQFTAMDVKKYFPSVKEIDVVYNGMDSTVKVKNDVKVWDRLKTKYTIDDQFILYVGGFAPRKNMMRLLVSYDKLLKEKKYNYQLLLCGKITKNKDIVDELDKMNNFIVSHELQNNVKIIGYLHADEKNALLTRAKFFIYPSLYEGFGLPVLEALSVGTPTVTTKNSVMEEVAKTYSLYVEGKNTNDMVDKMKETILKHETYKKLAIRASKELIPAYSWRSTGEKYYEIYKKIYES